MLRRQQRYLVCSGYGQFAKIAAGAFLVLVVILFVDWCARFISAECCCIVCDAATSADGTHLA